MTTTRPARRNFPADATRTALAEAVATRVVVSARRSGRTITQLMVQEVMSDIFNSVRYQAVPHPAQSTVFRAVKRAAAFHEGMTVRLSAHDAENRI